MARAFRRRRSRVVADLDAAERALLASLLTQTAELLDSASPVGSGGREAGGPVDETRAALAGLDAPEDPALQRLLPDGHRDDPIAAAQFRSAGGDSVRTGKLARIARVLILLERDAAAEEVRAGRRDADRLDLDDDEAADLLVALTDVRLVLGERLGLRTDDDVERLETELAGAAGAEADPRLPLAQVYDFLTWLQETLATALTR